MLSKLLPLNCAEGKVRGCSVALDLEAIGAKLKGARSLGEVFDSSPRSIGCIPIGMKLAAAGGKFLLDTVFLPLKPSSGTGTVLTTAVTIAGGGRFGFYVPGPPLMTYV